MKTINFQNVEELIFHNQNVQNILPSKYQSYIQQWKLAKRFPFLLPTGRRALLDFLTNFQEEDLQFLEEYFKERVVIEKLNYNIAQNYKIPLSESEICEYLCDIIEFRNFSIDRDDKYLYISFWR